MVDWDFLRGSTPEMLVVNIDLSHPPPTTLLKAPQPEVISATITRVSLYVSADFLEDSTYEAIEYITTLLGGLPKVRTLKIWLTRLWNIESLRPGGMFSFENLVENISSAASSLQKLTLEPIDHFIAFETPPVAPLGPLLLDF
jgi:hypothetical protein